ncbi:uncharacterized membrane protein YdcZ (DUF606 family) [Saccharothrix tamanrassetensis]|uniref:Uncharacterized membrane protein YdcZ (DUF606 family) n=1 Tax=Saccharothrix tamanrassetensis TaxID=1051531 RepID=A0A841CAA7_9PSEU|nr:hypothetical protein [Saccharothrix tamanrassetensis]MBB5954121.1 uncharacterized membrane protein YdcZ (DUF606 family) [Saccharothrix tamanrassetensis]
MREVLGIIMLVPQGLVPLVLMALDVDSKSWFVVMHLPPWAQLPGAIAFTVVGAVLTASGIRAERGR